MKTRFYLALRILWCWAEPPLKDIQYKCIRQGRFKDCHRAFTYDGLCMWHWNAEHGWKGIWKMLKEAE